MFLSGYIDNNQWKGFRTTALEKKCWSGCANEFLQKRVLCEMWRCLLCQELRKFCCSHYYYCVRRARSTFKGSPAPADRGFSFLSWTSQLTWLLFYTPPPTEPSVCSSLCGSSKACGFPAAPSALYCWGIFMLGERKFCFFINNFYIWCGLFFEESSIEKLYSVNSSSEIGLRRR